MILCKVLGPVISTEKHPAFAKIGLHVRRRNTAPLCHIPDEHSVKVIHPRLDRRASLIA